MPNNKKVRGSQRLKLLLSLLILLNIADARLSQSLIEAGIGREGNPFLEGIVGQSNFVILKVAGVVLCILFLWDIHRRHPRLATITTSFFIIFYSAIVIWNSSLFLLLPVSA
ncbi:DUF5658 family protein [Chloroflexota bacterium]